MNIIKPKAIAVEFSREEAKHIMRELDALGEILVELSYIDQISDFWETNDTLSNLDDIFRGKFEEI